MQYTNGSEINKLRLKIKAMFKSFYLKTDSAHRMDHIDSVMSNAIRICHLMDWQQHLPVVLVAVGVHDIFSTTDWRADHHIRAFNWTLDNKAKLKKRFDMTDDDVMNVAYAALEHRGSYRGERYNGVISEIMAAADRGIPSTEDVDNYLARSFLYARSHGKSVTDAKFHAIGHIKDKFGRNGYGRVPDWYNVLFAERLRARLELIEEMDISHFDANFTDELERKYHESL
ncbi:hypothetical protein pEaSNUABM11_00280 [Erwinia phage pEa_SNUABM_11]|nr:hypothetical protein pEaSNUABM11_00280 [Erwinia phage pEa_SNUABM_11]